MVGVGVKSKFRRNAREKGMKGGNSELKGA